jgi:two-component system nitrogen regulation response regulator GlnG
MEREKILVVDDEESVRWVLKRSLEKAGMETTLAKNGAEALTLIGEGGVAVALIDIRMPSVNGLDLLSTLQTSGSSIPVIVMTAQATMQNAIEAMRRGAFDYITKPFDLEEVNMLVKKALHFRSLSMEASSLRVEVQAKYDEGLVGNTTAMKEIYKTIGRVAESDATILIHGESGTGKELVARAIHFHGARAGKPFIAVNSAAIPSELLESELFGHEKGAFSGAVNRKIGKFEAAAGGTLFLDEIGDMSLSLQGKLLRVLQERAFERVGGVDQIKTAVRVIAATHHNLEQAVQEKRFRQDLFYRLNVIQINIPPLQKRKEDIPLLIDYFLHKYAESGKPKIMAPDALRMLSAYGWPGNVRELENAIQRAVTLSQGNKIFPDALPPQIAGMRNGSALSFDSFLEEKLSDLIERMGGLEKADIYTMVMRRVEKPLLTLVLKKTNGNQVQASKLLGINRNTLRKMIKSLKIRISDPAEAAEADEIRAGR